MVKSFYRHQAPPIFFHWFRQIGANPAAWTLTSRLLRSRALCPSDFVVGFSDILSELEIKDSFDSQFLLGIGQTIVKWKAHQAVADIFSDRTITRLTAEVLSHI